MIVSASRRTDIPAFHSEWFMNRLRAGYALVRNPVYRKTVYRVDLTPRNVDCIVFLTKDPAPIVPHLDEILGMGHRCMFQVTVTPYGPDMEPGVPPKAKVVDSFREVSERIGRGSMLWRYDPVMLGGRITVEYHQRKFATLCNEMDGLTDRCAFSFLDYYGKLDRKVAAGLIRSPDLAESERIAGSMARTAAEHGMELSACCGNRGCGTPGVTSRACMDKGTFLRLGIPYESAGTPVRQGCGCLNSVDIGEYDTCAHDCVYCYANSRDGSGRAGNVYDPESEMLFGKLGAGDDVVDIAPGPVSRIDDF